MNLENEIPGAIHAEMNAFIAYNPIWDQYSFMSSALAYFLVQNGYEDKAAREKCLNDIFIRSE